MRRFVQRIAAKVKGAKRYDYLQEYERLQWLSLEDLERHQFSRLKKLVNHAYQTVPYYQKVFKELGIKPDEIKHKKDYSKLPTLNKELIKSNQKNLLSSLFDPNMLRPNSTGGSTGEPLQFYQEMDVLEHMQANMMLSLKMAGWREGERVISIWGNPKDFHGKPTLLKRLKSHFSLILVLNAYNYSEDNFASWVETILRSGRVFIYGYPSAVADFAHYVQARKVRVNNVRGIQTSAEKLLPQHRELLENTFNCKVFDQYGSRECPGIAAECEQGGMHLFTHSAYVEFVDDPQAPEGAKKLLVTPLTSYAMPFLRYEIGDYALPLEGSCSCGRGFPLMQMKIGRLYDRFILANGQVVHGTLLVRQVAGIRGIKSFQFHQRELTNIDLNIVKSVGFDTSDEDKIMAISDKLAELLGSEVSLNIRYVESIQQTIGGKHRQFVSDVRPS